MESQRPDAMIKDERAVELVNRMGFDFSRVKQIRMTELLKAMRIIFTREWTATPGFPQPSPGGGGGAYWVRSRLALRPRG